MNKKIRILQQQDEAPKTYLFLALQEGRKKKNDNRKKSLVWAFTLKYRQ